MTCTTKLHPLTGRPLAPIGTKTNGQPIWPILGGSGDAGQAGGSGSGGDQGSGQGTSSGQSQGGGGTGSTADPKTEPKFSQAEVDRIVQDRVQRARGQYADYETLKERAKRADELEAAQGTEVERAEKKGRTEATAEVTTRYQGILRASQVVAAAAASGYGPKGEQAFRDGQDAVAQLAARGVLDAIRVDDQGRADASAIERELKALAEAKPYLLVEDKPAPPPPPASAAQAGVGGAAGQTGTTSTKVTPGLGRLRAAYGPDGKGGQQ